MCYNAPMTNPNENYESEPNDYDTNTLSYDDTYDTEEFVAELMSEGYTEEEARRMAGEYEYDDDDTCYGHDDLDRDVPDFNHGEDE